MNLTLFLLAINLFKILVARSFPIIGDEAYYWLWSQHLDLSYVSHPPMIAYVNFITTSLFGINEFVMRLTVITIVLLISLLIYGTAKELFDRRAAAAAVVVFNLLPTFFGGGMFLVPQTLVFIFWSLSFYLLVLIIKRGKSNLWYLLGITSGLGLLSDYVMALFFIGTAIFLALSQEHRFWFRKKEPYLAFLLAFLVFSPVIIWNIQHNFLPFQFWGGKMGFTPRILDNLLNFFGLQMVLYTPPIFILTVYMALRQTLKRENLLLSIFAAAVFLPFAFISPILNVGGHWPATAYLPAILSSSRVKKVTIIFALLVNILGFTYYLFLYPTPAELKGREFTINQELPKYLKDSTPKKGQTYYFANDIGMLGLISFHGKVRAYMTRGRHREVDLWGQPDLEKGDNVIYFALNETPLYKELKPLFRKVSIEPRKRLFNKDADLPNKTQIFICEGYLGGTLP